MDDGVIYMSVLSWTFAIGSLLALGRDRSFREAVRRARFAAEVRGRGEPFVIVCGFGDTGSLICAALDRSATRFVVVERDETRVAEVDLQGYAATTPALAADASQPENLLLAGLQHPRCRGVLAVTDDDQSNLAVAIAVRLLNPRVPVLARARSEEVAANLASFHTDHVINPFNVFGEYLSLLLRAPRVYALLDRLIGSARRPRPPTGCRRAATGWWRATAVSAARWSSASTAKASTSPSSIRIRRRNSTGRWCAAPAPTKAPLRAAGIEHAVGIVAGTDNDVTTCRSPSPREASGRTST